MKVFALCVLAGVLLEAVVGHQIAAAFVAAVLVYVLVRYAARHVRVRTDK